jgi:hypothetical protein
MLPSSMARIGSMTSTTYLVQTTLQPAYKNATSAKFGSRIAYLGKSLTIKI